MNARQRTKQWIYMDHAAATPLDGRVRAAMEPFLAEQFYNPSATYGPAVAVAKELQAARAKVAHWFGARPSDIVFTAGGTEANNLAIHGIMRQYAGAGDGDANVVVSAIEHEAILKPAGQYDCRLAPVDGQGIIDVEKLRGLIDDKTVLVSVMYANNEIGSVQPLRDIAALAAEIRERRRQDGAGQSRPLFLHTDACQAAPYLDLHAARLGVDLMTINGGKLYGPKQSGALYVKAGLVLRPVTQGGGQERGLRSGTENVAACVGLATALELAQAERHDEVRRLQALQKRFIDELQTAVPDLRINGSLKRRLPNNVHVTLPGQDNERLIYGLEAGGVLAAAGSACSAGSDEPSHVLRALGLSDEDAQASLRFTMGRSTNEDEVARTVAALRGCLEGR